MRLVCMSDTHTMHGRVKVPEGDVLIHAGDFTKRGKPAEIESFNAFLARQPHAHKIVVAGNHDFLFEDDPAAARRILTAAHYLQDEALELGGVRFYGSPWQPRFFNWAFNLDRGAPLRAKWDLIPAGTDVLITHGPPHGYGDRCEDGRVVGCEELALALGRVRPKVHIYGHIHEGYGARRLRHADESVTDCLNVSTCDARYRPVNPVMIFDI